MPGYYPEPGPAIHPVRAIYLLGLAVGGFLVSYVYSLFLIGVLSVAGVLFSVMKIVAEALISVMKYALSLLFKPISSGNKSKTLLRCFVRSFLTEEEEEYIAGDLREEFSQFQSRGEAYVWLSKQILTSILPLLGKNLKTRLASYFRKRIR
jgi:hypothetical protein